MDSLKNNDHDNIMDIVKHIFSKYINKYIKHIRAKRNSDIFTLLQTCSNAFFSARGQCRSDKNTLGYYKKY